MAHHCRHDHSETGGGSGHSHDHSHDHDIEDPEGESLWRYIDHDRIKALNELQPGSARHCFKPFHRRRETDKFVESNDEDPELIIYIPFTESVKLKSISVYGGDHGKHPQNIKMEDIDFSNAQELPSQQQIDLAEDFDHGIDYPLKLSKFQNVSSLTIYVTSNYGADSTRIYFIGFKGAGLQFRHGIVEAVYESKPQVADHKTKSDSIASHQTGF